MNKEQEKIVARLNIEIIMRELLLKEVYRRKL
jgi:hypothetical protein